jgi:hypothetical protein
MSAQFDVFLEKFGASKKQLYATEEMAVFFME